MGQTRPFGVDSKNAAAAHPPFPLEPEYNAIWWWSGVLWGTAATAIHNIQQLADKGPQYAGIKKLALDEDPLAFLGILVDCMQEWDRYSVSRESVITSALPLQGADVRLAAEGGKIMIDYGDTVRATRVTAALDGALSEDWRKVLRILG